ncbi:hypothetical protein FOC1_g10013706 [Fusarium oxysporum f. sp. cubense race 1]|uniref:Secreted protein n=1 Tax=Fusarium oxysporum f. sp. cubense (strain race 1) TaxID=1229664 RepID=N4U3B9_FUSC1|nr:hypothetical protein FOC1_g10013706 [Fusarium oxysporum f. sp. cubense race 1]
MHKVHYGKSHLLHLVLVLGVRASRHTSNIERRQNRQNVYSNTIIASVLQETTSHTISSRSCHQPDGYSGTIQALSCFVSHEYPLRTLDRTAMGSTRMHPSLCTSQFETPTSYEVKVGKISFDNSGSRMHCAGTSPRARMLITQGLGCKILRSTTSNVSPAQDVEV